MPATDLSALKNAITNAVIDAFGKDKLKAAGDPILQSLITTTHDAINLQLQAITGPQTDAAKASLAAEQKQITAQLDNLTAAGFASAGAIFWKAIGQVMQIGVSFALAAV